jgi:large subunit ribosomal protein L29
MADTKMKIADIRAMSSEDIKAKVAELRRHLFDLRSQSVTENLKNPNEIPHARKAIARMLTVLSERTRPPAAQAKM